MFFVGNLIRILEGFTVLLGFFRGFYQLFHRVLPGNFVYGWDFYVDFFM